MTPCCPPMETKASEIKNLPPLAHVQSSVAIKNAIKAMSTDNTKTRNKWSMKKHCLSEENARGV